MRSFPLGNILNIFHKLIENTDEIKRKPQKTSFVDIYLILAN